MDNSSLDRAKHWMDHLAGDYTSDSIRVEHRRDDGPGGERLVVESFRRVTFSCMTDFVDETQVSAALSWGKTPKLHFIPYVHDGIDNEQPESPAPIEIPNACPEGLKNFLNHINPMFKGKITVSPYSNGEEFMVIVRPKMIGFDKVRRWNDFDGVRNIAIDEERGICINWKNTKASTEKKGRQRVRLPSATKLRRVRDGNIPTIGQ